MDVVGRAFFKASHLHDASEPLNGYSYHFAAIVQRDACGQYAKVNESSIGVFAIENP